MRLFRNIFIILSSLFIAACSGHVDDSALPVLEVADLQIDLASETSTTLIVRYNGQDVTRDCEIIADRDAVGISGNAYVPTCTGPVILYALYDGKESNKVAVDVIHSKPQVESKFDRHVCLVEFTGAWCINCPGGYDNMMLQLSKPSLSKYKDNIHICAFHSNLEGADDLAIDATQELYGMFTGLAYPSFATDLRDSGLLTSDGISSFQPSIKASFEEYKPYCGVAVSSVINSGKAQVTIKVESEFTSKFRVLVLVVQDGIVSVQKTTTYQEGDPNYIHRHVVRMVATENYGHGEKMTENGWIQAGTVSQKVWSIDVNSDWVLENTEIYALVLDSHGYVNNMNVCQIDGGDSGFDLK